MEFVDNVITLVHIKGKNNVLVYAISRLETLNIYKEPLENPKAPVVSNMQENVTAICTTDMHTISTAMLHTEQKWDILYMKLVSQKCHGNTSSFMSVIMSANSILQKQQYIHGLNMTSPYHYIHQYQLSYVSSMTQKVTKEPFVCLKQ